MFRTYLTLFLVAALQIASSVAPARQSLKDPAPIYYYPHIHKIMDGKGYEGMGGDMVFFSYLQTALEVLKAPRKYDIYLEGYGYDLYRGSRHQMYPRDIRLIRRTFKKGFPKHISAWTRKQRRVFVEFGPVTVLYVLKKVRRIYAGDRWISKRRLKRRLNRCLGSKYVKAVEQVFTKQLYSDWAAFYKDLRKAQKGLSKKRCYSIFTHREKFLVRRLKRKLKRSRRPAMIIYGYSHDFGKYFKNDIHYMGRPELQYAASCYHYRNKKLNPTMRGFCASFFTDWLAALGHQKYFAKAIPKTLLPDYDVAATSRFRKAMGLHMLVKRPAETCSNVFLDPTTRVAACTRVLETARKAKLTSEQHAQALFLRAEAHRDRENFASAIADYNKAIRLNPRHSRAYHRLGWIFYIQKQYYSAIRNLEQSVRLDPTYAGNYNLLGLAYESKQEYGKALKYFSAAIKADPGSAMSYNNLAWMNFKLGHLKEGLVLVQKALKINPNSGAAYDTRAHIYEALGKYRMAIRDFKKALKLIPTSKVTQEGLKRVRRKL